MKKKTDVFFDIDGCFIDEKYRFNIPVDELKKELRKYFGEINFHLNSNRSLKNIIDIWSQIKTNGLIVYENGQGVFNPAKNLDENAFGVKFSRENLKKSLKNLCDRVSFISTDDLVKSPEKFFSSLSKEAYCEKSRIFTATVYPRVINQGIPTENDEFTSNVFERLKKVYGEKYNLFFSKKYGNIILTPKNALKSNPMKKIAGENRIASFGDEIPDILMFQESSPKMIGCPANAREEVKRFVRKNNGLVSRKSYTEGVLDFVNYIQKII